MIKSNNPIQAAGYRFVGCFLIAALVYATGYAAYEPDLAIAAEDAVLVTLSVTEGLSISSPGDTAMSQSLSVSVNTAIATTTWNIKTNSPDGYNLVLTSTSSPAMQTASGSQIPDFTGGGNGTTGATPGLWSGMGAATYEFGYSGFSTTTGTIVDTGIWGNTSNCGLSHTPSTVLKYTKFVSASAKQLANRTATTTTAGDDVVVCYAVQQNGAYAPAGDYRAYITATAVSN